MDSRLVLGAVLLCACKAVLGGDPADAALDTKLVDGASIDGALGAWGAPARIVGADSTVDEDDCTMNLAATELYFKRVDGTDPNLYVMKRASIGAAWGAPAALGTLNSTATEESPRLADNDLTLYFGRNGDIYRSIRTAANQPWQAPTPVTSLNTADYEKWAAVCDNGYVIVARQVGATPTDLYDGTIAAGAASLAAPLNSTSAEQGAMLTTDCLHVYFHSNRSGNFDIYTASRATTNAPWGSPAPLTDFNTPAGGEEDPWISADQRTFVFASNTAGNKDVYISTR